MERHIAKRLGIACAVISTPIHVQDVPARYSPVMGFEGANVLFDSWVHPLVMGLEEHLLQMFREDFEFHDGAAASHLPRHGGAGPAAPVPQAGQPATPDDADTRMPASLAPHNSAAAAVPQAAAAATDIGVGGSAVATAALRWTAEGERELRKIPFFVRGKARRNTETYAAERGIGLICVETLYEAKAHFGR
jgi:light-independent protochlorophyllide reductase subunit B